MHHPRFLVPFFDGATWRCERKRLLFAAVLMKIRVLIVDDEALSRERIRRFLGNEPGAEIVGECATGKEAVRVIQEQAPDVIFLDVNMPELDGFGVVAELEQDRTPAVVFVTAHDQFALQAFEINAVDYLLKPFDRGRFRTALGRARQRVQQSHRASAAPDTVTRQPAPLDCIPIRSGNRIKVLRSSEIDWIGSADNYAEIHVGSSTHLLRMTLTHLAERLSERQFARISRSAMVNLDRVQEMRPKSHGDYLLILRDGTTIHGSRNYRGTVARLLGRSE